MSSVNRDLVITTLINKLKNNTTGYLIERAYNGVNIQQYPAIYIFEDTETVLKKEKGKYHKNLTIILDCFYKVERKSAFAFANTKLKEILPIIDSSIPSWLDYDYVEDWGMTRNDINLIGENIVELIIYFEIKYTDNYTD